MIKKTKKETNRNSLTFTLNDLIKSTRVDVEGTDDKIDEITELFDKVGLDVKESAKTRGKRGDFEYDRKFNIAPQDSWEDVAARMRFIKSQYGNVGNNTKEFCEIYGSTENPKQCVKRFIGLIEKRESLLNKARNVNRDTSF